MPPVAAQPANSWLHLNVHFLSLDARLTPGETQEVMSVFKGACQVVIEREGGSMLSSMDNNVDARFRYDCEECAVRAQRAIQAWGGAVEVTITWRIDERQNANIHIAATKPETSRKVASPRQQIITIGCELLQTGPDSYYPREIPRAFDRIATIVNRAGGLVSRTTQRGLYAIFAIPPGEQGMDRVVEVGRAITEDALHPGSVNFKIAVEWAEEEPAEEEPLDSEEAAITEPTIAAKEIQKWLTEEARKADEEEKDIKAREEPKKLEVVVDNRYNREVQSLEAPVTPALPMGETHLKTLSDDARALLSGDVPESLRPRLYTKRDAPPPSEAVKEANRIINTYTSRKKKGYEFSESEQELVRRAYRVQSAHKKHRKLAKKALTNS